MYYNNTNVPKARKLRREMTPWERKLWYCYLSKHAEVRFYRQKPIGSYIVDFYCPKASLVIELDGGGHYEPEQKAKDAERTNLLEREGLEIVRFCNRDIDNNFRGVCAVIDQKIYERSLSPSLRGMSAEQADRGSDPF